MQCAVPALYPWPTRRAHLIRPVEETSTTARHWYVVESLSDPSSERGESTLRASVPRFSATLTRRLGNWGRCGEGRMAEGDRAPIPVPRSRLDLGLLLLGASTLLGLRGGLGAACRSVLEQSRSSTYLIMQ